MTIKRFLLNLFFMLLFMALIFGGVLLWLRFYTNHGQKLELPSYEGVEIEKAKDDANSKSFELVVNDSIHIVGKPGGLVWTQNPPAGSLVKENRKIYVDVTKFTADRIDYSTLGNLYGQEFKRISSSLETRKIKTNIKGYKPDNGEPDHILEVYYKGKLIDGRNVQESQKRGVKIDKGDVLDFILSKRGGFEIPVPDVTCRTLSQARAFLKFSKLNLGQIERLGAITDIENAYVVDQYPNVASGKTVLTGSTFDLKIQQEKPENCGN